MVGVVSFVAIIVGSTTPLELSNGENELLSHSTQSYKASKLLGRTLSAMVFPDFAVIFPADTKRLTLIFKTVTPDVKLMPEPFYSRSGRTIAVIGSFIKPSARGVQAVRLADKLDRLEGVFVGGGALANQEFKEQIDRNLSTVEMIALPLLMLGAFIVLRGAVAAVLPVFAGAVSLFSTLLCLRVVNSVLPLSVWSLNLVTALALGLSLDYSVILLFRFREELSKGMDVIAATSKTFETAGKTVIFSSTTVASAFASLLIFPIGLMHSIAIGGVVASVIAGAVATLIFPAIFSLLGRKVNALTPIAWLGNMRCPRDGRRPARGLWYRIARFTIRRPIGVAFISLVILTILASPLIGIRLTGLDEASLTTTTRTAQFARLVQGEFAHPLIDEIVVAARGNIRSINKLIDRINGLDDIEDGSARRLEGSLWEISIEASSAPFSYRAKKLVRDIRALPFKVGVTGVTAGYIDTATTLREYIPLVLIALFGVTALIVFIATQSVILPLKTVLLNVLSLLAAFGVMVWVFQDGRLEQAFDYRSEGAIVLPVPVLVAVGTFGILTDYGIFLLRRIREGWDAGLSNVEAIAIGVERTGAVVTSAAILFCIAIAPLLAAKATFVKEIGLAVIVAVMVDASVVRAFVVPSLMALFGKWNWWRPVLRRPQR
jgi:uncharacterized membrane protein YdfJ with MMPL/SSD domain